jgi:hypothetical protein
MKHTELRPFSLLTFARDLRKSHETEDPTELQWPVPFAWVTWLVAGLGVATERDKRKFQALTRRFNLPPDTQLVQTVPHQDEKEIQPLVQKHPMFTDQPARIISMFKAYQPSFDAGPAEERHTRVRTAIDRYNFQSAELTEALKGSLLVFSGNDVMQQLNGRQLYKIDLPKELRKSNDEQAIREHILRKLQKTVGRDDYTLTLRADTSLYEAATGIGVVMGAQSVFEMRQASDEVLEALVFGTARVWPELASFCLEIRDRWLLEHPGENFRWTPEKGFDLDVLTGVNGGWKVDHPLIRELCVKTIDGQAPWKEDGSETSAYRKAKMIAGGEPYDLMMLFHALMTTVLARRGTSIQSENEPPIYEMTKLKLTVEAMQQAKIPIGGEWFEMVLTEHGQTGAGRAERIWKTIKQFYRTPREELTA